ncbi:hypothetical protein DFS34DRAFT_58520 [Phlyctochytrium arcticum]|nr:hypothetical protein DFS34DRAFT_58520 [Phlyctochytrium arcticum]
MMVPIASCCYVVGLTPKPLFKLGLTDIAAAIHSAIGPSPVTVYDLKILSDSVILVGCITLLLEAELLSILEAIDYAQEVEVYVSGPCQIPIQTWDIQSLSVTKDGRISANDQLEQRGLVVIPNAVAHPIIAKIKSACDHRIEKAHQRLAEHHANINVGSDAFAFRELGSRGKQRFDLIMSAVANDDLDELVQHGAWMPLVRHRLGMDGILSSSKITSDATPVPCLMSVVYSLPGADNQSWHADGPPPAGSLPPYAVCVFIPLIDLTVATGFTQFWPGTHRDTGLLGFGPAAEVCEATVDGCVKNGDALVYDYGLLHRGMGNVSSEQRPVLQLVYHVEGWTDSKNYGTESLFD